VFINVLMRLIFISTYLLVVRHVLCRWKPNTTSQCQKIFRSLWMFKSLTALSVFRGKAPAHISSWISWHDRSPPPTPTISMLMQEGLRAALGSTSPELVPPYNQIYWFWKLGLTNFGTYRYYYRYDASKLEQRGYIQVINSRSFKINNRSAVNLFLCWGEYLNLKEGETEGSEVSLTMILAAQSSVSQPFLWSTISTKNFRTISSTVATHLFHHHHSWKLHIDNMLVIFS
jgi:hypothetical protein